MTDLYRRAEEARRAALDQSLPKWLRLSNALDAFSGLVLTDLSPRMREPLDKCFRSVNQVLQRYSWEPDQDLDQLSDADAQRALGMIKTLTHRILIDSQLADAAPEPRSGAMAAPSEEVLELILAELDLGYRWLPVEAIRGARTHRDRIVPKLIQSLQQTVAGARAGTLPDGNLHFFALFLLTEFKAKEALPAILEALTLPGELPFDLFGDAITGTVARTLAALADDQLEVVDDLIRNPQANEFVRWQAAQTFLLLVREGKLGRDVAVDRLRQHLRWGIEHSDSEGITVVIDELSHYAPREAMPEIEEAYRARLVDASIIALCDVQQAITQSEAQMLAAWDGFPGIGIDDCVAELQKWHNFREPQPQPTPPRRPVAPVAAPARSAPAPPFASKQPSVATARVGRNEPCPCGSGMKFKKCCGSRC
jgi:hypothetical protein